MRLPAAALLAAVALLVLSQTGPAQPDRPTDPDHAARMARGLELFKAQVRPILTAKCLKCHSGDTVEGELDLTDRASLVKGGQSGPAVVPGKSSASLLVQAVTHAREPHMPRKAAKLPPAEVAALAAWIDLGAPYDQPLGTQKKPDPTWTRRQIPASARQHWAFQPLHRVEPPAVADPEWNRSPIDRFLRAKMDAAGLSPNPPATKRQLIRRATFDLTGLPPTPAEVAAFLADNSPDAYEKLIDRLLASPAYGERWARHWLDLARFAESHGFEHDYDRPTAYPYRDFVIKALNADLPYDTFVKWQLAGDEFAPEDPLALMATGFLAAGVHSTQITKNEVEKHRYDELDDMLATTGTAFLGLTVGCCRCHDHKFDPFPQADYYRLLSTFTTTVRTELDIDLDPAATRRAKAAFDQEHAPLAAALAKFEAEELPTRLAAWEKSPEAAAAPMWVVLDQAEAKSVGGATFTKQGDGSFLVSGKKPDHDTYTFIVTTDLTGITALRLEALADPSLIKGGPGRAANGNFALSDLKLTATAKGGQPVPVKLRNPRATFEQKGLPVAAAIDDNPMSAWAVDPQFGKDHAAVFETESPVGGPGTTLTVTLHFNTNTAHGIGRPRLSVSTAKPLQELQGASRLASVQHILSTPAEKRTAGQKAALLKWYATIDPEARRLNRQVQDHLAKSPKPQTLKAMISSEGLPAVRLHTQGGDFLPETHFLRRGDPDQKEAVAAQGFLQVLTPPGEPSGRWQEAPPAGWRTSYRRRALANWLTDTDAGAGRLVARVIVNRLWQHEMGRGIVATPSDFGTRGEKPTHPELLDFLASELIREGWRLKPIHRLILTSAAYRQSAEADEAKLGRDGTNEFCSYHPHRRLEAEAIRDALLAVGGTLDTRMFGPGILDESSQRRSIYFTVKRSRLIPALQVFDAPDALAGVGDRPTTTVAPQSLHLMNSPQVRQAAHAFAKRIAGDPKAAFAAVVTAGYETALARPPTDAERDDAEAFLGQQSAAYRSAGRADARELAVADFCQVLLCLNEFVYVE
jgi:mono/diheme cytochrome c family protein